MATITQLLRNGRTFSFELFPPRSSEGERQLERVLADLEPLNPSFVSITYGAGGSTRERTHELVSRLLHKTSMTPMAHLACAAHKRAELTSIIERYAAEGLENLLALRGDPPLDAAGDLPPGELERAADLVDLAREIGEFCVAVAMHPEGHPQAPDTETDRRNQASKLQKADVGITQFFFRSNDYFRLVEDIRAFGVDKPIIPGLMPPSNLTQLSKMSQMSGADVPAEIMTRLTSVDSPEDVRKIGVEITTELARELLDGGAPGLHFYTMNRSTATREIYRNLGLHTMGQ